MLVSKPRHGVKDGLRTVLANSKREFLDRRELRHVDDAACDMWCVVWKKLMKKGQERGLRLNEDE